MVGKTDTNISSLEVSPCWTEEKAIEQLETIRKAEDREFFRQFLHEIGEPEPPTGSRRINKREAETSVVLLNNQTLVLARAMLTMSAPKKFHFIGHRLLLLEPPEQRICRLPATRDAAHAEPRPVVTTDAHYYAVQVGKSGVRGT